MRSDRHRLWQRGHALGEFFGRNVASGRAHRNLSCDGILIQLDSIREVYWVGGLLKVADSLIVHALNFAFFHAEDAQRIAQFIEVTGLWSQHNDLSAWCQNTLELSRVSRSEDNGDGVNRFIAKWESIPYVCDDSTDTWVTFRQVARGVRRNIQPDATSTFNRVEGVRQVVAGASANFQQCWLWNIIGANGAIKRVLHGASYGFDKRREVSFRKVCLARGNHVGVIAFVLEAGARCEGDISLFGDIK